MTHWCLSVVISAVTILVALTFREYQNIMRFIKHHQRREIRMPEFKVTFRIDQEEQPAFGNYLIEADSLLEAAKKADEELELTLKATVWIVERL
jgi:hypothetical protein